MARRGQSQGPDAAPDSRSAGFPPPPPPDSPVSPPPHPIGHLEGHLAGRRRVTWCRVSLISPVSPISPPAPPGPHSRVATRRLPLPRGGGLPGLIIAPGTPLLTPTPRVPFLLTPLVTPYLSPLVTPLPLVTTLVPLVIPVIPVVPVVPNLQGPPEPGLRLLPGEEEELSCHPEGAPPFLPLPLLPLLPLFPPSPSPLDPCGTTHHSPGSNSSSQSPGTVTWLTVPPLPPSAQGTYRVSPTPGTFPYGSGPLSCKGGAWGVGGGGGFALALGLRLGLGLGLAMLPLGGGGASSPLLSKWRGRVLFLGALGGGLGALGGVSSPRWCCCCCCCCHPPPPRSSNLAQPLRCGSMPPALLPASHLPKPSRTERAKLGFAPNIRLNSPTPTRRVRSPPSRHSTRTPRGSRPHVCTLTT